MKHVDCKPRLLEAKFYLKLTKLKSAHQDFVQEGVGSNW